MRSALHEGIFTVAARDESTITIELTDASHPVFQAHFEGNPLLPGYMQIDIIAALLGKEVDAISSAKYMKPVRPKDSITYSTKHKEDKATVTVTNAEGEKVSVIKVQWHDL